MLRQLSIIFGCLAIGELFIWITNIDFPSSIIGMLVLTSALHLKIIKLEWVKSVANLLSKNIGLFFIPAGVGIIFYYDLIESNIISIVIISVISTILVIWSTGWTFTFSRKFIIRLKRKK